METLRGANESTRLFTNTPTLLRYAPLQSRGSKHVAVLVVDGTTASKSTIYKINRTKTNSQSLVNIWIFFHYIIWSNLTKLWTCQIKICFYWDSIGHIWHITFKLQRLAGNSTTFWVTFHCYPYTHVTIEIFIDEAICKLVWTCQIIKVICHSIEPGQQCLFHCHSPSALAPLQSRGLK